ncbi:Uroporphyrinogen-III synthase [Seminavis robusta]|uniref:Uroporphyrinogen-III synthase n=1 Tax=Seminavis robusta TaxID=568900 RepID=A0A9N8DAU7_9STRA|nr:Uroporphyrinogen-III synthase [Seminavis robusta]|eukprot:Sro62_g035300.1 Uroporphyrinogen-III synthase (295) ;mRNA; r:37894-38778
MPWLLLLSILCGIDSSNPSEGILNGLTVLTTAPPAYAPRLHCHLINAGAKVVPCPTIETLALCSDQDISELKQAVNDIQSYNYVAFTSRRGIQALFQHDQRGVLKEAFSKQTPCVIALGADAEALVANHGVEPGSVLVPETPTPQGIVDLLKQKHYQAQETTKIRVLCPVPKVVGLTEPSVVPSFLRALQDAKFEAVRLSAYETRWIHPGLLTDIAIDKLKKGQVDVIAISSTAEVEGLQRLLAATNVGVKVVAHGTVTAKGAKSLGLRVDGISTDSSSFAGMVHAIAKCLGRQ